MTAAKTASAAPARIRKPSASAERGLNNIRNEMQAIADDMFGYKDREERQRGRDILAGLAYIDAAIEAQMALWSSKHKSNPGNK